MRNDQRRSSSWELTGICQFSPDQVAECHHIWARLRLRLPFHSETFCTCATTSRSTGRTTRKVKCPSVRGRLCLVAFDRVFYGINAQRYAKADIVFLIPRSAVVAMR